MYAAKFGFHVVSYYLSKYASEKHNVTYLGLTLDQTGESLSLPNVKVKEHLCKPGLKGRKQMLSLLSDEVQSGEYDVIFTQYFAGISMLKKTFCNENLIVDIRSGYLLKNPFKRYLLNGLLCKESKYLTENISINSKLLGHYLGFKSSEISELPLGADPVSINKRDFRTLRLIYIGTLSKRNIDITIIGLRHYINENPNHNIERYDIIGSGDIEQKLILELIHEYNLSSIVRVHGYINRDRTGEFLQNANVGVSFVPITPYYDLQPVTKTFEFLLAGLPVLATATSQNKRFIDKSNGVLIEDDAENFSDGIKKIISAMKHYSSEGIQASSARYSWENIILDKYLPYIEKVAKN